MPKKSVKRESKPAIAGGSKRKGSRTKQSTKSKKVARSDIQTPKSRSTKKTVVKRVRRVASTASDDWFQKLVEEQRSQSEKLSEARAVAEKVFSKHRGRLMRNPAVTGIHIGYRRMNDQIVSPLQIAIRVHLDTAKYEEGDPRIAHKIERSVDGVPIDILTRRYASLGDSASDSLPSCNTRAASGSGLPNDRADPLVGGVSIAREGLGSFGTLGIPAFLGSEWVLVTNKHVIGSARDAAGRRVVQPGRPGEESIGDVSEIPAPVHDSTIDAALVRPDRPYRRGLSAKLRGLGPVTGRERIVAGQPDPNLRAFKIGARTTSIVFGRIQSDNATVFIRGFGNMHGQIIVNPIDDRESMIDDGDSGSILVQRIDSSTLMAIGLCHAAGSDGSVVACHWEEVESRFGIRLYRS